MTEAGIDRRCGAAERKQEDRKKERLAAKRRSNETVTEDNTNNAKCM